MVSEFGLRLAAAQRTLLDHSSLSVRGWNPGACTAHPITSEAPSCGGGTLDAEALSIDELNEYAEDREQLKKRKLDAANMMDSLASKFQARVPPLQDGATLVLACICC